MTNWDEVANKADIDNVGSKVDTANQGITEIKQLLTNTGSESYFSKTVTTNANTNTVVPLGMTINLFKHISNDGSVDVKIAFTEAGLTTEGANGYILLKAGEVLSELNIKATSLYMLSTTTTTVRVVGVV